MINQIENQYTPDFVSPPGETLLEIIEGLGMSQAELAHRMGLHKKTVNEIIKGKAAITPQTAIRLERVLGTSAEFWNNREQLYRQHLARMSENAQLATETDWLDQFPVKSMIKRGWIQKCKDEVSQLRELLGFFGVASPEQWEAVWGECAVDFRMTTAYSSEFTALSAWLRQGELMAQAIDCQPFNANAFRRLLINDIRPLTVESPEVFQPETIRLCAQAGVAVVFLPQLPKARVSGATRWLTPTKAIIQLSLRYKKDDHLWFTFFHEAGHILLHGKRDVFLEDNDGDNNKDKEKEANEFARETLIPNDEFERFVYLSKGKYRSIEGIKAFASKIGIAPGIVVGRLQHDEYLEYTHCNALKRTFQWKK